MAGHRMGETLEGLFEGRCAESGVSFEEEARELRIPAKALREKLSGRDGFKKAEAERVGEFLGPVVKRQLTLGPYAAREIDANLRNVEFLRLKMLPDEEREAKFHRDPGLREDFERYGEEQELEAKEPDPLGELEAIVAEEIQNRLAENPRDGYGSLNLDALESIFDRAIERYTHNVAVRAGKTLEHLVKEGRYRDTSWNPTTHFVKSSGINKDRFAKIEKGNSDLKLSEIARCSVALGVSPSVAIGDITEEEWRLVEQLRGMGDSDRELVKSLIERLASGPTEGQ